MSLLRQDLNHNTVLPFTEDHQDPNSRVQLGYRKAWAIRIHPAHQYIYDGMAPDRDILQ
jgi:hypothetical protein